MSTSTWRHTLRQNLAAWSILHAGGLCCVGVLWMVFGSGERGLGPYFEAVGRAAISFDRLALYVALISVYSAGVEVVLRLIQERLLRRTWPSRLIARLAGVGLPALLYGLTHSIYHLPGVIYALILGVLTASAYAKWRSIGMMAAWHVQWNLIAVAGSMCLAVMMPGAPREHMIATYKSTQIARGGIVSHPRLGWIDQNHYDAETYASAFELASLPTSSPEVPRHTITLRANLHTQWGTRHPITRDYAIATHTDPKVQRAIACGVTLDFQDFHERQQAQLGRWSGLALSAYQRDDMAATWALCMDQETGQTQVWGVAREAPEPGELIDHVSHTLTLEGLRELAMQTDPDLWGRVAMARALWRVTSSSPAHF
jgi:hypothetical protein